jgi:molybdopterin-guanine dinucleotide biosynthesis protein B
LTRIIGFAGWSGAGKTTLIVRLIPLLVARGLRVATLKHAHHGFDVDREGKDSWLHRKAGAQSVLVASDTRWALMHELGDGPEPTLAEHLARLPAADIVLVEGWKRDACAKIEVFRQALGKPALYPEDPSIVAVAADVALPDAGRPVVDINDVQALCDLALGDLALWGVSA